MSFTAGAGTRYVVTSTASQSSGTVLTGPITATAGTATADTPAFNITQTWNNAAVTFTGLRFNVTDTASNANSLLMDLQVGGTSQFSVNKSGTATLKGSLRVGTSQTGIDPYGAGFIVVTNGTYPVFFGASFNVQLAAQGTIGWTALTSNSYGGASDTILARDAANTLAQRNGVNAQTFNLYGTYTDGSNYRRVAIAMTAAGVASIAPAGLGTGASGNVLHISGLPTANPGPGILWNDAGTVKVGT